LSAAAPLAIRAEGVGKKHCRDLRWAARYAVRDIFAELVPMRPTTADLRDHEFWALQDVTLEIAAGEAVAVLGPNGAGKSTLLMVLFGLLKPDRGIVRTSGRVEAIIELGSGFDDVLTGRENVRVGAAVHGMGRARARRLLDEVVAFSELGDIIDAPLRSYSSGMRARLAYALAAHLEPDVLLVDEVLAVGDLAFQLKCFDHMRHYLDQGGTLVLVTHDIFQAQAVCQRAIVLGEGRVAFDGPMAAGVGALMDLRGHEDPAGDRAPAFGPTAIESVVVTAEGGPRTGARLEIDLHYRSSVERQVRWGFGVWTADRWVCIAGAYEREPQTIAAGPGTFRCSLPQLPLLPGRYLLRAALMDAATNDPVALFGYEDAALPLNVSGDPDAVLNAQLALGQLTELDVVWR
jgi:lipopolysaccharide transport system ATP-binding protein